MCTNYAQVELIATLSIEADPEGIVGLRKWPFIHLIILKISLYHQGSESKKRHQSEC